jgi:hypothetical protein
VGGYLAASIGTLAGGTVGVAVGRIVGMPLAERAAGQVADGSVAEGLQGILEAAGTGLGAAVLGIFVFVVAVLMTAGMGAVAGCGVALRLSGNQRAGQTALLTGCLGPPVVLAVGWVAQALYRPAAGAETYPRRPPTARLGQKPAGVQGHDPKGPDSRSQWWRCQASEGGGSQPVCWAQSSAMWMVSQVKGTLAVT